MARKQSRANARQRIEELLKAFSPKIRAAFLAGVDDLRANASVDKIVEALERGDIEAAVRALNLDTAAFHALDRAIADAFYASGVSTASVVASQAASKGLSVVFRFNGRALTAERLLSTVSGTFIREATADMVVAARQTLTAGLAAGRNPRSTALDLVGRIDNTTGRRTGGTLGLTSTQEAWVRRAKEDLLSGDAERLRHYLSLSRRNKTFDKIVRDAIAEGGAVDARMVDRMVGKLSDSYLLLRGETVARTETIGALNAGNNAAFEQAFSDGVVKRENVTKVWLATQDSRTRDTHAAMNGQEVPFDQPFVSPSGAQMMYPGDSSLGASASELVSCRCTHTQRIDFTAGLT